MKTKVRVKREDLLRVVEGRVSKAEAAHKRAVSAHPAKLEAWEKAVVTNLERALADARRGKMPVGDRFGGSERVTFPNRPQLPTEDRSLCKLRRMAATLKMGADPTLMLSQDDADDYFGPCKV